MTSKQQAAEARAAAARKQDATERLSALEVERQGYVRRGDEKGTSAVDDEIAHWSSVLGIPTAAGPTTDDPQDDGHQPPQEPNDGDDEHTPADDENGPQNGADEPEQPKARRGRAKAAAGTQES